MHCSNWIFKVNLLVIAVKLTLIVKVIHAHWWHIGEFRVIAHLPINWSIIGAHIATDHQLGKFVE